VCDFVLDFVTITEVEGYRGGSLVSGDQVIMEPDQGMAVTLAENQQPTSSRDMVVIGMMHLWVQPVLVPRDY
jgi:hypothetical protein